MYDLEGEAIAYEAEGGMLLEKGRVGDAFVAYEQASKKYREKDRSDLGIGTIRWNCDFGGNQCNQLAS